MTKQNMLKSWIITGRAWAGWQMVYTYLHFERETMRCQISSTRCHPNKWIIIQNFAVNANSVCGNHISAGNLEVDGYFVHHLAVANLYRMAAHAERSVNNKLHAIHFAILWSKVKPNAQRTAAPSVIIIIGDEVLNYCFHSTVLGSTGRGEASDSVRRW